MIAVCLGIGIIAWLPSLTLPFYIATCVGTITLAYIVLSRLYRRFVTLVLLLCIGVLYGCWFGFELLEQRLPIENEDLPHRINGYIVELPQVKYLYGQRVVRFKFHVIDAKPSSNIKTLLLKWPDGPNIIPGQQWRLTVKPRQPRGLVNPSGFDYQQWLVQQGVDAQGSVMVEGNNQLVGRKWVSFDRWRWQFSNKLDQFKGSIAHLNIIKALLIADKRDVKHSQWKIFADTGTIHLLVISGLHIGIMSAIGFYLGRVVALICWPMQIIRFSNFTAISFAALYAACAGFSLPTQRALIMVVVYFGATLLSRNLSISTRFSTALLICLLMDPLSVITPSFWLSFVAVGVILFCCCSRRYSSSSSQKLINKPWLRSQIVIFLGLTPVLLAQYYQAPLLAVLVNLIALPLFSFVLIPLLFIFSVSLAMPITGLSYELILAADHILMLFNVLVIAAHDYASVLSLSSRPLAIWALAVIGCLLLLLPKHLPGRYFAFFLLLPLMTINNRDTDAKQLRFNVFDVGQGLSVLIRVDGKSLLYDVGASWPEGSIVKSVATPYFRAQGISILDTVVISHNDNDHAGGFGDLLQDMPITQLYTGEPLGYSHVHQQQCKDQRWQWGEAEFKFIPNLNGSELEGNNRSCVLKISYRHDEGYAQILLTGDIERVVEQTLVTQNPSQLKADVLFAPHHGSLSSSSWPFIKRINPSVVIYSTGYKNRFNHPHQTVVKRYQALGSKKYNTATDGAIKIVYSDTSEMTIEGLRWVKRYYWQ
ncbi:MAG: competence protein ComEC [Pseudohongiellaceae bacterium]|jgi:competence protein ComEC